MDTILITNGATLLSEYAPMIAPHHVAQLNPLHTDPQVPLQMDKMLLAITAKNGSFLRIPAPVAKSSVYIVQVYTDEQGNVVPKPESFQVYEPGMFSAVILSTPQHQFKHIEPVVARFVTYRSHTLYSSNYRIGTDLFIALAVKFNLTSSIYAVLPILRFTTTRQQDLKKLVSEPNKETLKQDWEALKQQLLDEFNIAYETFTKNPEKQSTLAGVLSYIDSFDPIKIYKLITNLYRTPASKKKREFWKGGIPDEVTLLNELIRSQIVAQPEEEINVLV